MASPQFPSLDKINSHIQITTDIIPKATTQCLTVTQDITIHTPCNNTIHLSVAVSTSPSTSIKISTSLKPVTQWATSPWLQQTKEDQVLWDIQLGIQWIKTTCTSKCMAKTHNIQPWCTDSTHKAWMAISQTSLTQRPHLTTRLSLIRTSMRSATLMQINHTTHSDKTNNIWSMSLRAPKKLLWWGK